MRASEREISISETGDVYPCQLLHAAEFKAGNIRELSLAEIYYESPVFNRLRGINVDTLGKCSTAKFAIFAAVRAGQEISTRLDQ